MEYICGSREQSAALTLLASVFGEPVYVNSFRPSVAIHVDFAPCDAYPFGSSWRIQPDGVADDITDALLYEF